MLCGCCLRWRQIIGHGGFPLVPWPPLDWCFRLLHDHTTALVKKNQSFLLHPFQTYVCFRVKASKILLNSWIVQQLYFSYYI
jgi:hypothetical protein